MLSAVGRHALPAGARGQPLHERLRGVRTGSRRRPANGRPATLGDTLRWRPGGPPRGDLLASPRSNWKNVGRRASPSSINEAPIGRPGRRRPAAGAWDQRFSGPSPSAAFQYRLSSPGSLPRPSGRRLWFPSGAFRTRSVRHRWARGRGRCRSTPRVFFAGWTCHALAVGRESWTLNRSAATRSPARSRPCSTSVSTFSRRHRDHPSNRRAPRIGDRELCGQRMPCR